MRFNEIIKDTVEQINDSNSPPYGTPAALQMGKYAFQVKKNSIKGVFTWGLSTWGIDDIIDAEFPGDVSDI
jgi:hypothetical protein